MFVFLISDNPVLAPALELAAKRRGERFYHMEALADALFFIHDLRPDVVVLDGALVPESFDWGEAMRAFPVLSEVRWVALSAPWPIGPQPQFVFTLPVDPFVFHETLAAKLGAG
jgi:hypothetical protein